MDKIYSRPRLLLPKLRINISNIKTKYLNHKIGEEEKNSKKYNNNIKRKTISIFFILIIAIITINKMIGAINVIIYKQCSMQAKSIATKVSNEQATYIMSKYKYDDLFNIVKDDKRECFYD